MTIDPELRVYTVYEWVVEEMDGEEIIECYYFDEKDRVRADAQAAQILGTGGAVDFGLCRKRGSDADGEEDRAYAYRLSDGSWPSEFDNGCDIPKRFAL